MRVCYFSMVLPHYSKIYLWHCLQAVRFVMIFIKKMVLFGLPHSFFVFPTHTTHIFHNFFSKFLLISNKTCYYIFFSSTASYIECRCCTRAEKEFVVTEVWTHDPGRSSDRCWIEVECENHLDIQAVANLIKPLRS